MNGRQERRWLAAPVFLLATIAAGASVPVARPATTYEAGQYSPEIAPYVDFLSAPALPDAAHYVLSLFDDADVVVLGERAHPEITQYELILKIVSDPRFIQRVGHVFTEIGAITVEPAITDFLTAEGLGDAERDARLRDIYRDFSEEVLWARFNYYDLLRRVYELNQTLPKDKKVLIHPVGLAFTWQGMTEEAYGAYMASKGDRDRRLAEHVVEGLAEIARARHGDAKALVIMNYRHSFPHLEFPNGGRLDNTTGFLLEMLPGRVRNVMLNAPAVVAASSDDDVEVGLVQDGRWDAAFAVTGNAPVGFDFAGTPFGVDSFDYFPFGTEGLTYSDVYSGFVFYKPISEHRLVNGIPGIVDEAFANEIRRRLKIAGRYESEEQMREFIASRNAQEARGYESVFRVRVPFLEQIGRWMEARKPPAGAR